MIQIPSRPAGHIEGEAHIEYHRCISKIPRGFISMFGVRRDTKQNYSLTVRMTPMGVCWLSWPRGLSFKILTYSSRSMLGSEVPRI